MGTNTLGLVCETTGAALENEDYVLFQGGFRMIAVLDKSDEYVKISFRYLREKDSWDMVLTPDEKLYKLSSTRLTGMRED